MDFEFINYAFKDLLEARIVGCAKIRRHANPDQQNCYFPGYGELDHLSQVFCALVKTETPQPIVAAQLDNQVGGLMLGQQLGQALPAAKSGFPTYTGINYACLRETRPYIGAE